MTKFYSKTTGGFYLAEMRADYDAVGTWPADAIEITDTDETTIRTGLATGGTVSGTPGEWIVTPPPPPSAAALWAAYQATAKAAIEKSDITILRCAENSVTVPAAWAAYRKALRAILIAANGDPEQPLPIQPAYPAGT